METDFATHVDLGLSISNCAWLKTFNTFHTRYLTPMIVLCGLVVNLLVMLVFTCTPLRRMTIAVYMACLSIADFIFLVFLGLRWLDSPKIQIFALNGLCQTMVYLTYVVSCLSLWFIVTFTAELYCSIHCTSLHKMMSGTRRAALIAIAMVIVTCGIYLFSFWFAQVVRTSESQVSCEFIGSSSWVFAVPVLDAIFTLILPFSLLIYMNLHTIFRMASISKRKFKELSSHKSMPKQQGTGSPQPKPIRKAVKGRRANEKSSRRHNNKTSTNASEEESREMIGRENGMQLSLNGTHTNIQINNVDGRMKSVAKLVVEKDKVGITIEKCESIGTSGENNEGMKGDVAQENRVNISEDEIASFRHQTLNLNSRKCVDSIVITATAARRGRPSRRKVNSSYTKGASHCAEQKELIGDANIVMDPLNEDLISKSRSRENSRKCPRAVEKSLSPLKIIQKRCLKMLVSAVLVFLVLNLPLHTIRIHGLLRSLADSSYRTTEVEFYLYQFLLNIYHLNFVVNVITYSGCTKGFQAALMQLPKHISNTLRQLTRACLPDRGVSLRARGKTKTDTCEHSCLMEICIPEWHLLQTSTLAPNCKPVSAPCLLQFEPSNQAASEKPFKQCNINLLSSS